MPLTLAGCGHVGGDNEPLTVLLELARRHPGDEFHLIGRSSGDLSELPSNVVDPWRKWGPELKAWCREKGIPSGPGGLFVEDHLAIRAFHNVVSQPYITELDAIVLWVGQHGSSNSPVKGIQDPTSLTKPQDAFAHYCAFLFQGVNAWRDVDPVNREEVYLNADPRNYHKMRDLKWPLRHPVLTQFKFRNMIKHERYGDTARPSGVFGAAHYVENGDGCLWVSELDNVYARLEVCSLAPGTPTGDLLRFDDTWAGRQRFGICVNEARAIGVKPALTRLHVLRGWVMPLEPSWVRGSWSQASQVALGRRIDPAPWDEYFDLLRSVRSTFTTPSSGSGWATTKPWEAFANGTVCFFHPSYDTQNNVLGDAPAELREYLRVVTASQLADRVQQLDEDETLWRHIVYMQRDHFEKATTELQYLRLLEKRVWG